MTSKNYPIYVNVSKERGEEFEELLKLFTTPATKPTKKDIIELAIRELYNKNKIEIDGLE